MLKPGSRLCDSQSPLEHARFLDDAQALSYEKLLPVPTAAWVALRGTKRKALEALGTEEGLRCRDVNIGVWFLFYEKLGQCPKDKLNVWNSAEV